MMTATPSTDYADLFFEHLSALREYAERVFVEGERLDIEEETAKSERMREFLHVGVSCEFTEQQLILLLLSDLIGPKGE